MTVFAESVDFDEPLRRTDSLIELPVLNARNSVCVERIGHSFLQPNTFLFEPVLEFVCGDVEAVKQLPAGEIRERVIQLVFRDAPIEDKNVDVDQLAPKGNAVSAEQEAIVFVNRYCLAENRQAFAQILPRSRIFVSTP